MTVEQTEAERRRQILALAFDEVSKAAAGLTLALEIAQGHLLESDKLVEDGESRLPNISHENRPESTKKAD